VKTISVIVLSIVFSINVYSQRSLSDKQWIEDLEFFTKRLDSIHPNPYKNISKDHFQIEIENLKSKIPAYSDNEIIVEFLRIISLVIDGHTRLHGNRLTSKWYPLRIERFSNGYYITAITKEYSGYFGAKIISVNNQPVDSVFLKIKQIIPHDNPFGQDYFAPMYFAMSSILCGLHIIKSTDDSLVLNLKINDHMNDRLILKSIDFQTGDDLSWFWKEYAVPDKDYINILKSDSILPLYLKKYIHPFWYEYLKELNTVYFAFNECASDENNSFESFNNKLWKFIDSVKAKYLIIDLRNNFGGTNSIIMPLLHEIIKHDDINKKGNLFIITSKKTFSAALDCASWIELHCNPIFVGEPTGAGPNHSADPDFSYLPNSKILLMISKYYWQDSWPWDNRSFIEPKIKVDVSSDDYFNYKDPVTSEIFKFIKQNK
jgi:hypothetical protein